MVNEALFVPTGVVVVLDPCGVEGAGRVRGPDLAAQVARDRGARGARLPQSRVPDRLERLNRAEIVPLEIEPAQSAHPWLKFAGIFKDNPLFDDVLTEIETYRRELDMDGEAA